MRNIFGQLNERGKNYSSNQIEYEDECIEESEKADMSTQFSRIQKNQLLDLKQHLERSVNTLPFLGFNSGRYDLNLIKSYLIPYVIRNNEQETSVIKKANDLKSFKFGYVQFLDIMKFLSGATLLDSFLKDYKASETKRKHKVDEFFKANHWKSDSKPDHTRFWNLKNFKEMKK